MQGFLTRAIILLLTAAGLIVVSSTIAYADTTCEQLNPATGQCMVWADSPGTEPAGGNGGGGSGQSDDGPKDTGSGASCYFDPGKQGVPGKAGPVPCSSPYGYWSNDRNCYIEVNDPPLPAGDPAWEGHQPGDGATYNCYQPQTTLLVTFWAATPPAGAAAGPSPREVAQMAIEQLDLSAIEIGIAPEPGAGNVGLVGMPVWMWAKHPDAHTYGPASATASAGGITVTATARVHQITWDMGDGTEVVCHGPGTPYEAKYGQKKSPTCGHVYTTSSSRAPGQTYTVTATSSWVVTWEGAGQTGTIRLNGLYRSVQIAVGEAQVLVN